MERLQFDVESPKMTTRGPETTIFKKKHTKNSEFEQRLKKSVKDKRAAESLENPMCKKSLAQSE